VVRALGLSIVTGEMEAGASIPSETELMHRYGVSRGTIRESMRVLVGKGLVLPKTRIGTTVKDPADWNILDAELLEWAENSDRFGELIISLTEARFVIEPAAAAMAAERATARDLMALEAGLEGMNKYSPFDPDFPSAHFESDYAFHSAVIRASKNVVFAQFLGVIRKVLLHSFQRTTMDESYHAAGVELHRHVMEAIRLRQPQNARDAMAEVIRDARARIAWRHGTRAGQGSQDDSLESGTQ
jgi:DNA-binding FadR family transcriptional regulator